MTKPRSLAFLLLAVSSLFVALSPKSQAANLECTYRFEQTKVCAQLTWLNTPAVGRENKFQLQFFNPETQQVIEPQGKVMSSLFMPDMGHGSAPTRISHLTETGLFLVANVQFTMSGLWEVRVALRQESGAKETRSIDITL